MISRLILLVTVVSGLIFMGCTKTNYNEVPKVSRKTGRTYGKTPSQPGSTDAEFGPVRVGQQMPETDQIFVEGGTFHMGGAEEDIGYEMNNRERQVTVHSFFLDECEVSNVDWKEFLYFYEIDSSAEKAALLRPDTSVWYRDLAYNEPFVELYFQNPAFNQYPVVGVSWYQCNEYCKWRTSFTVRDKVNKDPNIGLYPSPKYRLPTEAEWEYAARGLLEQELYPWEGRSLRDDKGRFKANMKRGRGDYAGRSDKAGSTIPGDEGLNDGYMIPGPVKTFFLPNDFGLYNMAGNVAEWTLDAYRVLAFEDVGDFQPFRRKGAVADQQENDDYYGTHEPDSKDRLSLLHNPYKEKPGRYNPGKIATEDDWDRVKVYRGGSWADVAYYHSCGTRRFFNADSSASSIGFRCAMSRVGSPSMKY